MRYLSLAEILTIHTSIISTSGGSKGIRDLATLESTILQIKQTFDGQELYPDVLSKAAALCFSICLNHPFVDGNKRTAHAAMSIMLVLNGFEIESTAHEQEVLMLELAAGKISQKELLHWLRTNIKTI